MNEHSNTDTDTCPTCNAPTARPLEPQGDVAALVKAAREIADVNKFISPKFLAELIDALEREHTARQQAERRARDEFDVTRQIAAEFEGIDKETDLELSERANRIAELEQEAQQAHAAGYAEGVEAAAQACEQYFHQRSGAVYTALVADIRALLPQQRGGKEGER